MLKTRLQMKPASRSSRRLSTRTAALTAFLLLAFAASPVLAQENEEPEVTGDDITGDVAPAEATGSEDAELSDPAAAGDSESELSLDDQELQGDLGEFSDMSLEELLDIDVVVTATKTSESLAAAPAVITVLHRQDIARRGYQSLAEALRHVVGFYIVDDHVIPNAGVRGVAGGLFGESGTVKLMIDGRPVPFRATGGNWLGPELIPLSLVERVEVIRGPSSALYGADAFLGVINVITRKGEDVNGADARVTIDTSSAGELGTDYDFTAGARKNAWEVVVAGRLHEENRAGLPLPASSPAPRVPEYRENDLVSRGSEHKTQTGFARGTYHFSKVQKLSFVAHRSEFERGSEFSPWAHLPYGLDGQGRQHETRIALRQNGLGLISENAFGEKGGLTLRGYYFSGGPTEADRIDVGSELFELKRDFGYEGLEGQVEGHFEAFEGLDMVVGTEVTADRENLPSTFRVLKVGSPDHPAGEIEENTSTRQGSELISNLGVYAQTHYTGLKPNLTLTAGARWDNHSIYDGQFSARVGAISNPVKPLFVKLLYGSAFLAPSPLTLYGVPYAVGDIVGNPDLDPQRVNTVEGQVAVYPVDGVSLSTGLAYSLLQNKAAFVQQGLNQTAQNLSEVESLTWESEITAKYEDMVEGYFSAELPYVVRDVGGEGYQAELIGTENVIYPRVIYRVGASGQIPEIPLRPGLEALFVGSRRASETNILENGGSYRLAPYTMLDATVSTVGIELFEGRETVITVKGRNLLKVTAPDPGFAGVDYPMLPRSVMTQVRQQF